MRLAIALRMAKTPPWDICERTFEFALASTQLSRELVTRSAVDYHLALQLLDSATSVGANVEEARDAYSRREFAHKNSIALKEARESRFWLRILSRHHSDAVLVELLGEANQLVGILTSTVRKARSPKA
jgi:four helix bundle protein